MITGITAPANNRLQRTVMDKVMAWTPLNGTAS